MASAIPGLYDAVSDGISGTLVPRSDIAALGAAIDAYLVDASLRGRHGKAGRERALRDFRQQDMWESLFRNYVQQIGTGGVT